MKQAEFDRLAHEGYNRIPVTLETFADLDSKWHETLNKARAQLRAAEMAEAGLDTRFE